MQTEKIIEEVELFSQHHERSIQAFVEWENHFGILVWFFLLQDKGHLVVSLSNEHVISMVTNQIFVEQSLIK
jgi:hypothetical protein